MVPQIKYVNHMNESVVFGVSGLFMTDTELHDYEWECKSDNDRISYFTRGITNKKIKAVIASSNRGEAVTNANKIMECFEKDVLNKSYGRIIFGDYYMICYINSSKKSEYNATTGMLFIELNVVTDNPMWIKEYTTSFRGDGGVVLPDTSTGDAQVNLDYSYDFPYDFSSTASNSSIVNKGFMPSDFKMILYGQATNPSLYIGGHQYSLSCNVNSGEYLEIDSKNKTIYLVEQDGTRNNYFRYRNKSSYIFEKIPSGENTVTWARGFSFDVTLYEERSEPKWT